MGRTRLVSVEKYAIFRSVTSKGRDERRKGRLLKRLQPGTSRMYLSDMKYICKCALVTQQDPLSDVFFSEFLDVQMVAGASGAVVTRLKAAYLCLRRMENRPVDSDWWHQLTMEVEGERTYQEAAKAPTGAVDWEKLLQLQQVCFASGLPMYASGFALALCAGLRHQQLQNLVVSDLLFQSSGDDVTLRIRAACKRKGEDGRAVRKEGMAKTAFGAKYLLQHLKEGKADCEKLFPHWCAKTANGIISMTAAVQRWSSSCVWRGMHCLRHGARLSHELSLQRLALQEMQKGGWKTKAMSDYYGKVCRLGK